MKEDTGFKCSVIIFVPVTVRFHYSVPGSWPTSENDLTR